MKRFLLLTTATTNDIKPKFLVNMDTVRHIEHVPAYREAPAYSEIQFHGTANNRRATETPEEIFALIYPPTKKGEKPSGDTEVREV